MKKILAGTILPALMALALVFACVSLSACSEGEIKTVKFEGVEPTAENVENGTYELSRPFIICYQSEDSLSAEAKDFIGFIFSEESQALVAEEGYISVAAEEYTPDTSLSGNVKISGSTSVGPLMQDIAGLYESVNPGVRVEINQNGSGTGITQAMDGTVDFAMSSRDLNDEELAELGYRQIATDGIAIIVNAKSDLENVTRQQVKELYEDGTPFEGILCGISREAGSGTRTAFEEICGIEKNYTGTGFDSYNSTNAVISAIKSNSAANKIGYVSLGAII